MATKLASIVFIISLLANPQAPARETKVTDLSESLIAALLRDAVTGIPINAPVTEIDRARFLK